MFLSGLRWGTYALQYRVASNIFSTMDILPQKSGIVNSFAMLIFNECRETKYRCCKYNLTKQIACGIIYQNLSLQRAEYVKVS